MWNEFPFSVVQIFLDAFTYNLAIAALAMVIGSPISFLLGYMSTLSNKLLIFALKILKSLFCNVPSFVLLFYFTLIVPSQLDVLGAIWFITPFTKAVLALSIPVIGYYSDVFEQILRGKTHFSLATFKQFFIVILMASTTASVIGVPEIMATANAYIASKGDVSMMLKVYFVVVLIFVISGLCIQILFYIFNRMYGFTFAKKYSWNREEEDENSATNSSN